MKPFFVVLKHPITTFQIRKQTHLDVGLIVGYRDFLFGWMLSTLAFNFLLLHHRSQSSFCFGAVALESEQGEAGKRAMWPLCTKFLSLWHRSL